MGQPVAIVAARVLRPDRVRYELDRSLTGAGHENYTAALNVTGDRPPDVLARRLFDTGGVKAVHIHSNVVTIDFEPGDQSRFEPVIRDLYIHYLPGVKPTPV